jgi:hypothetical protein
VFVFGPRLRGARPHVAGQLLSLHSRVVYKSPFIAMAVDITGGCAARKGPRAVSTEQRACFGECLFHVVMLCLECTLLYLLLLPYLRSCVTWQQQHQQQQKRQNNSALVEALEFWSFAVRDAPVPSQMAALLCPVLLVILDACRPKVRRGGQNDRLQSIQCFC